MAGISCDLAPEGIGTVLSVRIKQFPNFAIVPAVDWPAARDAANGEQYGVNRGEQSDIYTVDVTFFGTATEMADLADWLEEFGRDSFRLTNISGFIFPPHLDQSGEFAVAPVAREKEKRVFFSDVADGVNVLDMTLRAVEPTLIGSPSLSGLTLGEEFTQGANTSVEFAFSDEGVEIGIDTDMDSGIFATTFVQETVATRNALRFLMLVREEAFTLPAFPRVDYPFGEQRGAGPKQVKLRSIKGSRQSLGMWAVSPEFVESFE
jgi:hypothetical protein